MKLTSLKKLLLCAVLLNTLVACKYQVDLTQLDDDGNQIENIVTVDHKVSILNHSYSVESKQLKLVVELNAYTGKLKADLEMTNCTKSYPATCFANLRVYSIYIDDGVDFHLPSVLVKQELNLDLSNLRGVANLNITDDRGKSISISLEEKVNVRIYDRVFIKDVKVDQKAGTFTITAKHQECDGPGALDLDSLNRLYAKSDSVAASADEAPTSLISPILPIPLLSRLVYKVATQYPEIACGLIEGTYFTAVKTFSFKEAGIPEGQTLRITDATKESTLITNAAILKKHLLPISNIKVDLRSSTLIVESPYNIHGKMVMGPCLAIDPRPGQVLRINQSCNADFLGPDLTLVGLLPGVGISKFPLSEVGLGQNASELVINFRDGRAVVSIDNLGEVSINIDRLVNLRK